ncbi:MAG: FtsX-like permease family protein [Oscillospiraceae bacterium]
MKKIDILGIAFGNFKRRKLRSVLTVLGVVIGTASIVTMMSLGIAIDASFSKSMEDMGDLTTINVSPGWDETTGKQKGDMNDELINELKSIENVSGVSPEIRLSGKLISGKYQSYASILGVDMQYSKQLGLDKLASGSLPDENTVSSGKNIYAVFGSEAAYQFSIPRKGNGGGSISWGGSMIGGNSEEREPPPIDVMADDARIRYTYDWSYGENNPSDTSIKKKPVLYNIKPTGVTKEGNWDSNVYIDIETAKRLKKEADKFNNSQNGGGIKKQTKQVYDGIKVFADNMQNTVAITKTINEMGYQAWSSAEWISTMKEQTQMIQMLLGGIGSVSLLVAAIGITNTMIMSIYERTREIGIMKVIGCYLKDIRTMFLVEAGFIGLFGGAVGVALSYGLSFLMNTLVKGGNMMGMGGGPDSKLSVIPPWLALLAIAFAILVALISGFLPARRAMKLSALEAMRT